MHAAPVDLQTEIFTRLPDALHYRGPPTSWAKATLPGIRLHSFLEAPVFDRAGNLYCVDIASGRLFRISPSGEWTVLADYDGEPHGLALHRDGRLFLTDHRHGVMTVPTDGGTPEPLVDGFGGMPFHGCNDLVFSGDGDLYFSDSGWSSLSSATGRVFRLGADNVPALLLDGIPYPNGLVLDSAESSLLLAVTYANAIWRLPLAMGPGSPRASLFIQMSGGLGPDGLALDEVGNLAVAHARSGTVWVFSPSGEPLHRIRSCAGPLVTNLAYGGEDRRTLYITEAGSASILTVRLPIPGRATFGQIESRR